MKLTVMKPVEIEATAIRCLILDRGLDVDEDELVDLRKFPGWASSSGLDVVLDLETRKVRGWPAGQTADVYLKVVDGAAYELLGPGEWTAGPSASGDPSERPQVRREVVVVSREDCYVPNPAVPGKFGDYFALKVASDGTVEGWNPTAEQVQHAFFPDDDRRTR